MTIKVLFYALSLFLLAAQNLHAQKTYIPDDNFEKALIHYGHDSGEPDDSVATSAIRDLKSLNIHSWGIKDLTGIGDFTSLEVLNCAWNELTELNLHQNKNLIYIDCSRNQLTQLNLISNLGLMKLYCTYNLITTLDLSKNTTLTHLYANHNQLTSLNIKNGNNHNLTMNLFYNPELLCIEVDDPKAAESYTWYRNTFTSYSEDCSSHIPEMTYVPDDNFERILISLGLDFNMTPDDFIPASAISKLKSLNISGGNIKDLTGIEDFKELETLTCSNNMISELNLSANSKLKYLYCSNNQITKLDLSVNNALTELKCNNNFITELDLSENINLTRLECMYNQLADMDLSSNGKLAYLDATYNQLTGLNLRNGNNTGMMMKASHNENLLCIATDDPEAAYKYSGWTKNMYTGYSTDCSSYRPRMIYVPDDAFEQALIDLHMDYGTLNDSVPEEIIKAVKTLNISKRNISDLTGIQEFYNLEYLNFAYNNISAVDLGRMTNLSQLFCYNNQLEYLLVPHGITIISCENNKLTDLDLSHCPLLNNVNCKFNQLSGLNLKNGNNANLKINARANPYLYCIVVDDPQAIANYFDWFKDNWAVYSSDCSNFSVKMLHIPDYNFEYALYREGIDNYLNDSVPAHIVENIKRLEINGGGIRDLTGIEYFTRLERLECEYNKLTEMDLSKNPNLTEVYCSNNRLWTLDLRNGNNHNMRVVAFNNFLDCIHVDDPELPTLKNNWLKDPFTSYAWDCPGPDTRKTWVPDDNFEQALIDLGYDFDGLNDSVPTAIISKVIDLRLFGGNISDLTGIEDFVSLKTFWCIRNSITDLNLNSNKRLNYVDIYENKLLNLNVDSCKNLYSLNCNQNLLNELDVSNNLLLNDLRCSQNKITRIDITQNKGIYYLEAEYNNLNELDLRNGRIGGDIRVRNNPNLYCIQVDDPDAAQRNPYLLKDDQAVYAKECNNLYKKIFVPDNNFELALIELGYDSGAPDDSVSLFMIQDVTSLDIRNKNISDLTGIEGFAFLTDLYCSNNNLMSLDLTTSPRLVRVECDNNRMETLNVSYTGKLKYLVCNNNQLTELDLSRCTGLTSLTAFDNGLITVNLKNGHNYKLEYAALYNNPQLICIQVDDVVTAEASTEWVLNGNSEFSEDCASWISKRTWIPDDQFEQILINMGFDSGVPDNFVPTYKISYARFLDLSYQAISDLTGIEDFKGLTHLICSNNDLRFLDVSKLNLLSLECSNTKLHSLDLNSNSTLTTLDARENENLVWVNLQNGNNESLTEVNLEDNPNLMCIQVDNAETAKNYTSWLIDEKSIFSEGCELYLQQKTFIPDANFEQALIDLGYDTDGLNGQVATTSINTITYLSVSDRNITSMEGIQDFKALTYMDCSRNNISLLDVSTNRKLEHLRCPNNKIVRLDLSLNPKMIFMECNSNQLTDLNLKNGHNEFLREIKADDNPGLFCIMVDDKNAANGYIGWVKDSQAFYADDCTCIKKWTYIPDDNFEQVLIDLGYDYGVPNDSVLTRGISQMALLNLSGRNIKSLEGIEDFESLLDLNCMNNQLTELDLSKNKLLTGLDCSGNLLTKLNLENCTRLNHLGCSVNQLTDLTLNAHPDLIRVYVSNNKLVRLQLKNRNNQKIVHFISIGNPELNCIEVDDPVYSDRSSMWLKDSFSRFSSDCNAPQGAGVKETDFSGLINLYNVTNGENWYNKMNWLDTINHTVNNWQGITVENGHVTKINLSDLNLEGQITGFMEHFDSLVWIDLSDNNLSGPLMDVSIGNKSLQLLMQEEKTTIRYMNISNNRFTFADLESAAELFSTIPEFIYSPQANLTGMDTTVYKNTSIVLSPKNYVPGNFDSYKWEKNGTLVQEKNEAGYEIINAMPADSGLYHQVISNSLFPYLQLAALYHLSVLTPVGINERLMTAYKVYPNPASDKIYIETQNKKVDVCMYSLTGSKIIEINHVNSEWISIAHLKEGFYNLVIQPGDSEALNFRVIVSKK